MEAAVRVTICFPPGFEVEGIVLSVGDNSIRVAMRGWDDAGVFEFSDGDWLAENGDRCAVHTSGPATDVPRLLVILSTILRMIFSSRQS
jgi:hypothetical protein